uniref:CRS2-associated factor 1, chloroplastic n=1 Tax=Noccaea caerulescens TaxID=107243 RepID=A0A1J3DBP9_NOCCA
MFTVDFTNLVSVHRLWMSQSLMLPFPPTSVSPAMSLKLNILFPIFAPSLSPNPNQRGPSEIRFSRWGNANADHFEQRRRSQEELEAEIRRDRRFDAATKIVHTHDSAAAASEPKTSPFRSRGTPSLPSARSIPGRRSKYSKPDSGPNKPKNKPKVPDSRPQLDAKAEVKLSEDGLTYVIDGAPFEFKYSYTETPKVKPLKLREPAYAPFGPTTMGRPWTGRAPLPQSQKTPREFDSFRLPPPGKKGLKPIQKPGPFRPGVGPRYVYTKEEILGEPLTKEEIRELITSCLKTTRQLNMGRDGLTHNMLNNIHDLWKRRRVCKIKCKGVCTVDMDNVCEQLEEKIGGKVIYRRGGVLFLFRGRNYNHRTRPRFPLMLWKPVAPVYPRLIQQIPEGLTLLEATEMRKKGRELMPICKLGKNGVYCDLVKNVKEAFEVCELVRIDCQGMKGSDFRKIGAKLKDLVPCVLISFENEQILVWRGREWKSSLTIPDKKDDILGDIEVDTDLPEDDEASMSPNQTPYSAFGSMKLQNDPDVDDLSHSSTVDLAMEEGTSSTLQSSSTEDETQLTTDKSLGDHQEPEQESETSEEINKQSLERVQNLMKQAVESGSAIVLDATDLDADTVFAKAVAFSTVATPGPVFQHGLRKEPTVEKKENREFGYRNLETKTSNVVVSRQKEVAVRVERDEKKKEGLKKKLDVFDEDYREVLPHGTLKVDELAKLLA